MKRDQKQELLQLTVAELKVKLQQLQADLIRNRQERRLQDRAEIDVKAAYKTQQVIKMIKTELRRREIEATQVAGK